MKGLIFKEITLSKKQAVMSGSIFIMFSAICILIRLSMECGNLADDAEVKGHLLDNLWVMRYMPLVVLAFLYNPSITMYDDIDSNFLRFCRTTSLKTEKLISSKMISLFICEAVVFIIDVIYLAILNTVGEDGFSFETIIVSFKMILLFSAVHLIMLFFSTIAKNKKTFETILVIVVTLGGMAYTPVLIKKMEKYNGRQDIDVLDLLRLEYSPFEKYVLPICIVMLLVNAVLCFFVGSRLLERRHS